MQMRVANLWGEKGLAVFGYRKQYAKYCVQDVECARELDSRSFDGIVVGRTCDLKTTIVIHNLRKERVGMYERKTQL